jgi:hypothetical protein
MSNQPPSLLHQLSPMAFQDTPRTTVPSQLSCGMPPMLRLLQHSVFSALVLHTLLVQVGLLDPIPEGVYLTIFNDLVALSLIWHDDTDWTRWQGFWPPRWL